MSSYRHKKVLRTHTLVGPEHGAFTVITTFSFSSLVYPPYPVAHLLRGTWAHFFSSSAHCARYSTRRGVYHPGSGLRHQQYHAAMRRLQPETCFSAAASDDSPPCPSSWSGDEQNYPLRTESCRPVSAPTYRAPGIRVHPHRSPQSPTARPRTLP